MLGRFKIGQKLSLIALAFFVPLSITTYFLLDEKSIKIDFAESEMLGVEYLRPLSELLVLANQHAEATRRLQDGDADAKTDVARLRAAMEPALRMMEIVDSRMGKQLLTSEDDMAARKRVMAHPSAIAKTWEALRPQEGDRQRSTELHSEMISGLRNLITHIGDTSKLILDPDLDTYYNMDILLLREPEIIDRVFGLQADTQQVIAKGGMTSISDRASLAGKIDLLEYQTETTIADIKTVISELGNFSARSNHEMQQQVTDVLTARGQKVTNSIGALVALVRANVIVPEKPSLEPAALHAAAQAAVTASTELWQTSFDQQSRMLEIRRDGDLTRQRAALWSVLFAVVLSICLTVLVGRSITKPVARAAGVAEQLARGELPEKIDIGTARDEPSMLLASINKMLQFLDLRKTMGMLNEASGIIVKAIADLDEQTNAQSGAIGRQAAALQETQVTSQEIKQTSEVAAQKASEILRVAERAEEVSRSGEATLEQTLDGLADIGSHVQTIADEIGKLSSRTAQIVAITQTVKDLADQSNMLALNAAIEAVRSGEHGKGFAVVAREIRNLADQSIQATDRVKEILDSTSGAVQLVVSTTDKGKQRMEAGIEQLRASGDNLRELATIVRESSDGVRQIAAAVGQQNAGIVQIFAAVTEQTKMMEETTQRLDATREAASVVMKVSKDVSEVAGRFRL